MFKNTASQKFRVFAFDATTNLPKTGDAANISCFISKDFGAITQTGDTSATEESATNAPGYYLFDATQAETNADDIAVTGKSATGNVVVIGAPARITTLPPNFGATSINTSGQLDVVKIEGTDATDQIRDSILSDATRFAGANVALIKAKTDNLPTDPADASDIAGAFTTLTGKLLKYVQLLARKDAAIATDNATELGEINANGGSGAGGYSNATDAHEALRDRGDAAWITATGFAVPGDIMKVSQGTGPNQLSFSSGVVAASLNAGERQAIWEFAASLITAAGSIGKLFKDTLTTPLGTPAGASIAADIIALKTVADAINAKTTNLPADPADESNTQAKLDTIIGYIDTEVATLITELASARAEPSAVPAANATLGAKVDWLFMLARNKRITTTTLDTVRNDGDGADVATRTVSDNGTTTLTLGKFT